MKITHIAIWTDKLEVLKEFYVKYFDGLSNQKYINEKKGFESYFISFEGDATLELMSRKDIVIRADGEKLGLCHLAFELASKEAVNDKTEQLRRDGYVIAGETRVGSVNLSVSIWISGKTSLYTVDPSSHLQCSVGMILETTSGQPPRHA